MAHESPRLHRNGRWGIWDVDVNMDVDVAAMWMRMRMRIG